MKSCTNSSSPVPFQEHDSFHLLPYPSEYQNNRPCFTILLEQTPFKCLLDTGADVSLISAECMSKLPHSPLIGSLAQHVQCIDFRGEADSRIISEAEAAKIRGPTIKLFVVMKVQLCNRQFHFPFHYYEAPLSMVILGNDFMYVSGISPHIQSSRLMFLKRAIPLGDSSEIESQEWQNEWEMLSYRYIKQLQSPIGKQGLPIASTIEKGKIPSICVLKNCPENKYNMKKPRLKEDGIDLAEYEHLVYPAVTITIPQGESREVPATTKNFRLQKGIKYEFIALSRAPFYDVWFTPGIDLNERGTGDHSMVFSISSSLGVTLTPIVPFAIVIRALESERVPMPMSMLQMREDEIPEISTIQQMVDSVAPKEEYPETSTFIPKPYMDFPFPNEEGVWPVKEDWTQSEINEAEKEFDKWVIEEKGTFYLTPKPKVKLLNNHPKLQRGQRVLIAKMIAQLPDGMWNSENPDHLPGVPMTDVVIRVRLIHDSPVYARLKHISESERLAAAKEINKWVNLGIYEEAKSPYSCNLIWVFKKHSEELRTCINYTPINKITVKDRYPLPNMENLLSFVAGSEYLTSTDVRLGFHNFFIHPDDRHKLAFSSTDGQWQPIRLPFGWCNGPSVFMRQMNVTHKNMQDAVLMFLDDAVLRTPSRTRNLKQHISQFITVAANDHMRGLVYEDKKGQIACQRIELLGFTADGEGISPTWKSDLFERLLQRSYNTVNDLQSTIGSLQWLKRFVPNFTYIIRPLHLQVKRGLRLGEEKIVFNEECKQAIKTVESYIVALPKLQHADVEKAKNIYLVIGPSAFAVSIWQNKEETTTQELVAFWSRVWPLNVDSYSNSERYALAIREILKFYAYLLVGVPKISFYTADAGFTAMAQDDTNWSERMQRFLVATVRYNCSFRLSKDPICKELNQLLQHVPEKEDMIVTTPLEGLIAKQPFGSAYSNDRILLLPMVFIDGACQQVHVEEKEGSWGCYWRKNSMYNSSGLCVTPPFTNNRAEIEALIHTIEIRNTMTDANIPWIAVSDSSYLCNAINLYRPNWQETPKTEDGIRALVGPQGAEVANSDLWLKLFDQLKETKVYVTHVRRKYTEKADELAKWVLNDRKLHWKVHGKKGTIHEIGGPTRDVYKMQTRSMSQRNEMSDNEEDEFSEEEEDWIFQEEMNRALYDEEINWAEPNENNVNLDSTIDEAEFLLPPNEGIILPNWNRDVTPNKKILEALPVRFRLEEPQLNKFAAIMTSLPVLQKADAFCAVIINYLLGSTQPLPIEIDRTIHRYSLEPITTALVHSNKMEQKRFVAPAALQEMIISLFHKAAALGSHNSYEPTLTHIQRYFWWEGIGRQVKSYCQECTVCIAAKAPTGKVPGFLTPAPLPKGPWYKVHADTIRGLPVSYNISNVLIMQCSFSKFILAAPIHSLSAAASIDALTMWFTIFGSPQIFVADRGSEFVSNAITAFLNMWGVVPRFSEAYNPQANGQAEAAVKIISRKLYTSIHEYHRQQPSSTTSYKSWLLYLPYVVMAYNCSPNRITGFSPYEIMFGRPSTFPLPHPEHSIPVATESALWDYLVSTKSSIQIAQDLIKIRLEKRRIQIKRIFDRFRSPLTIDVGDYVFIYYPKTMKLHKLHPKAYGPFPVTHISRLPGTREPVGITVNLNTQEAPILKRFARGRVHPFRYLHRNINWAKFLNYSEQCIEPTQLEHELTFNEIAETESCQAIDLTTTFPLTAISLGSKFELSLMNWKESTLSAELRSYTDSISSCGLYEPVIEKLGDLTILPVDYQSFNESY